MTPAEREILQAVKTLTSRVEALQASFDELTLADAPSAAPVDPMTVHLNFISAAKRRYETRNSGGHNG